MTVNPAALVPGVQFSTPHETGCTVATAPDELGNFEGFDSDAVRCSYSVQMVDRIEYAPAHLGRADGRHEQEVQSC